MSHAFDTGASKPQRTLILEGVLALLAGLKKPAGYLNAVIGWPRPVRSYTDVDGIVQLMDALSGRAPSIAVHVGDASWGKGAVGGFTWEKEIELLLYFASTHKRDHLTGRIVTDAIGLADDNADPGLNVMMEHAFELVLGRRPGGIVVPSIKQVRPQREEELVTDGQITIWLQTYRVIAMSQISEWRSVTQLLDSIRFRAAIDEDEVHLPTAATDSATIDFNRDDLAP